MTEKLECTLAKSVKSAQLTIVDKKNRIAMCNLGFKISNKNIISRDLQKVKIIIFLNKAACKHFHAFNALRIGKTTLKWKVTFKLRIFKGKSQDPFNFDADPDPDPGYFFKIY